MRISDWSSDVCSSDLAIRQLFLIASQLRRESWRADPDVGLYRMTVASLMMAIVLGAALDVILLLLFGEANDRTMTTVMTLDRICDGVMGVPRSAEHTYELQSLMRISYAVFCLKKKKSNKE